MLKYGLLAILALLVIYLVVGNSQSAPERSVKKASVQESPKLPSIKPLRRLGDSDFRLTRRDGNDRPFRFSPDGKLLAGANWQEVKVWTFPDGKLQHDFSDAIDSNCIAFSEDGSQLLALEQREMALYRFDVSSGELISRTPLQDVVDEKGATRYWLSPDGKWLSTTEVYNHVTVWDTSTGKRKLRMQMQRMEPYYAPISPDGVLTLWDNLFLKRYDLATGRQISQLKHYRKLIGLISNPSGTYLAAYSSDDQAIVVWNAVTGERAGVKIPSNERGWMAGDAAISADGKRLVYHADEGQDVFNRKVAVVDVESGKAIRLFPPPDEYSTNGPVISPDGKWVFLAGDRSVFSPVNADTGQLYRTTPDHVNAIEMLSFTPNGSTLIAGSRDQRCAWDVSTGKPGGIFDQQYYTPFVAAVDNGRVLVSSLRRDGLRLQDISTGAVERVYETGSDQPIARSQLGADRKTFVGLIDRTYRRWDIETGKAVAERTMPPQPYGYEMQLYGRYNFHDPVLGGNRLYRFDQVRPAERLPDNSIDWGQIDLLLEDWTTQRVTNRLTIPYPDHFNVADALDDRTLVVVTSDDWYLCASRRMKLGSTYLIIWDAATGWERLRVSQPRPDYFAAFAVAAVTRDVRLAATARNRNQVDIWNAFTGELLQRFIAANDVTKLTFADDGRILASGHLDGSIYLWDTRAAWTSAIPKRQLSQTELLQCWEDLAREGHVPATALQRLLGDPIRAVEMLKRNLQPADDWENVSDLIGELINSQIDDSERKVRQLGPRVANVLYDALQQSTTDMVSERIRQLIDATTLPVLPPLRRRLLAVNLAEQIGSAEAKRVLEKMATGAKDAPETRAALAALQRLSKSSQ